MNKAAIKSFAVGARQELVREIAGQVHKLGLDGMERLQETVEEMAYTWFIRLIALRYMEVNGILPGGLRLFAQKGENVRSADLTARRLIHMCNRLSEGLPKLFPIINERTEALFPTGVLSDGGLIDRMLGDIDEQDWMKSVEMLGWLHQYYHTEQKDKAFEELLRENRKISRERIAAATQLFTPDWIVRYLVENSLGRLWMDSASGGFQSGRWKYFAFTACEQPVRALDQAAALDDLKQVKLIDPCMGSGHMLLYAFEMFLEWYGALGICPKEAAADILMYNLYGLDIDERAYRMSYLTLLMKAQQYDPEILSKEISPHVYTVTDSRFMDEAFLDFVAGDDAECRVKLLLLRETFWEAREYGSLLKIPDLSIDRVRRRVQEIDQTFYDQVLDALMAEKVRERLEPLLTLWDVLSDQYEVVVTNPPYMGKSHMDKKLRAYVRRQYPLSNHDLFAVFIERCGEMLSQGGYQAMITQHSWMFLERYRQFRERMLKTRELLHMVHLGAHAFEEISGEVVQTTAWIMRKEERPYGNGTFVRLVDAAQDKEQAYLQELESREHTRTYQSSAKEFFQIPGAPIAYWATERMRALFGGPAVSDVAVVVNGMFTCNNRKFLRRWYEVPVEDIFFDCRSKQQCLASGKSWYPYNKGGSYRRWYGNHEYVVRFAGFGEEIRDYRQQSGQSKSFPGQDYYFQPSLSWSFVSSAKFGIRYYPPGFVFDIAGSSIFPKQQRHMEALLGILASDSTLYAMKILNPTINCQAGDVRQLPVITSLLDHEELAECVWDNIRIAREDWDSFETSWDFRRHPLCAEGRLEDALARWRTVIQLRREQMRKNEERIDEIVRSAYGLEYRSEHNQVTLCSENDERDVQSLVSYLVGCVFGRYSPDMDGLCARADGAKSAPGLLSAKELANRVLQLVGQLYGEEYVQENLMFLSGKLGRGQEQPAEGLRGYLDMDFFKFHAHTYHGKPIYWKFDSGRRHAFSAFFYIHGSSCGRFMEDLKCLVDERRHVLLQALEEAESARQRRLIQQQIEELSDYSNRVEMLRSEGVYFDRNAGVDENYQKFQTILAPKKHG